MRWKKLVLVFLFLAGCNCPPGVAPTPENMCILPGSGMGGGDAGANPDVIASSAPQEGQLVQRAMGPAMTFPDGTNRTTVFQVVGGVLRPFINPYVFFAWHTYQMDGSSFAAVQRRWNDETFATFRIGGPMTSRPGTWIVAPQGVEGASGHYLVERCNILRLATPDQLEQLYGTRWRLGEFTMNSTPTAALTQNLTPTTWGSYRIGPPLPAGEYPIGQLLLTAEGGLAIVAGAGNQIRSVTPAGEAENNFNRAFAVTPPTSITFSPVSGTLFFVSTAEPQFAPCPE